MKRELPTYIIEGTTFIVDVDKGSLIEKANPNNVIDFSDMADKNSHYEMLYDRREKNWPPGVGPMDEQMISISIPNRTELDPEGMALKYGLSIKDVQGKTDFEIMVNQEALQQRLSGLLPTIDIAEQTFYVDIRMDMLRPKDDFLSKGIVFSQIDHYYNDDQERYTIPYNPQTHEFQELDYDRLTAVPKDLIVVSFPHEMKMDPVGFNRKGGWDETEGLKQTDIKPHFEAKIIDWKETEIEQTINRNIERINKQQQEKPQQKSVKRQRKGPKL